MKKAIIVLALMVTLSVQAQTSRIMLGLGGGISTTPGYGDVKGMACPMGTFNFGYSILGDVKGQVMLGLRTGINASYAQIGLKTSISEAFTNMDYYGNTMEYTVTSGVVSYLRQQINVELPVMMAIVKDGFYCNVGCKLMAPVWNRYRQEIAAPDITAYYPRYEVAVTNNPVTGMLTDEQKVMSGIASLPKVMIGLAAEIGYVWNISGEHRVGFDVFVDYSQWGFGGATVEEGKKLVEVGPIVDDCQYPTAKVSANLLTECGGYKMKYLQAGVKIVYAFDVK